MFKILCLFAIVVVVAAGYADPKTSSNPAVPGPMERIVKREALEATEAKESAVEEKDDLERAETFGHGYHKVIHVYPRIYPGYHYGHGYPYAHGGYGYGGYGYGGYY
ncbi:uncharacterized protein LOC131214341 [Anopheles bellator]|uniref:uncharacterized protein LOC131214341 n=1 Tax=Anopheles bellator TaxID=139047 RepID=UPI0026492D91|nr:uncharacterized protein LOC131214341 [Anopheles bellator]